MAYKNSKKSKTKTLGTSKRKTHVKGNNSVYTKDFDKLMKDRTAADNKSAKRMKVIKTNEVSDAELKAKIYMPPQSKKSLKNSKKAPVVNDKHMYHKRVKSDQIYSVKLLLKGDDKLKCSKHKITNTNKKPMMTRPSTHKHDSISSGYSQFVFKKGKGLKNTLLQDNGKQTTFKSEN